MITTLLPANQIPEGTTVRKPTGQKLYILKREVKIHGEGGQTIYMDGVIYLCCDDSINGVKDSTVLAVDWDEEDLAEFLEDRRSHQ